MISYNNSAPTAVNNVGQFGATEGSIGAYKSAAEYAADSKYWALLSQKGYDSMDEVLKEVERLFKEGALLEEDIEDLKRDFENQNQVLTDLIQQTEEAIDNTNTATENANQAAQDVLAQLDKISNMSVIVSTLPSGTPATGSFDNETGVFSFGIPEGLPGKDGKDGTISDIGDVAIGTPDSDDYGFFVDKMNGDLYRASMSEIAKLVPAVTSFNGRVGQVVPAAGDYTVAQVTGAAASGVNSDIKQISGLTTALSVSQGGTGATSAAGARAVLNLDRFVATASETQMLSSTGSKKVFINNNNTWGAYDTIASGYIPLGVAQGGTGGGTADAARMSLVAAKSGDNSDITSMTNKVTFTQSPVVPDAVDDSDAVTLRQLHNSSDSDRILANKQAVARYFGVKQSEVVYFSVGAVLSGYKVIYDKETQKSYSLPADLGSGVTAVSLNTDGMLVHSAGDVDLGELAVIREEYVTLPGSFDTGVTVTTKNELVVFEDGKYRWDGTLPKTVPAESSPGTTGGIGTNAWIRVGEAAIKNWSNSSFKPLQLVKSVGSFAIGGSATEGVSALKNPSNGYYYTPKSGTITVAADSSPNSSWQCVGLLNGYDIDDLRNWGEVKSGDDILPLLRTAYELTPNKITIPPGQHRIVLIDTLDPVRNETYPMGLRMTRQNVDIEFSTGASIKMDVVTSSRYVIIDAYYAHNSKIINPVIIGDVENHTGSVGEWGYGIRNFNSSNLVIKSPNISYCWGDGILWFVSDEQQYGGAVTGTGIYTRCRRQGISVISCRGLYIEDSLGINIQGASEGPWATIDVEPDIPSEFIIDLVIGSVRGVNNQGPALLFAVHQLTEASQPINVTVGTVTSIGCQRCMEIRGDGGVSGNITIDSVYGRNSKNQELQTVKWREGCKFFIRNMTSLNCNQVAETSSAYGVAIGIYNNYAGGTAGGITIENLNIINRTTTLTHPIAITNTADGPVGTYVFNNITYDRSKFTYPEIYNPAAAGIRTNSRIYQEFTTSGTVTNSRWCNEVRNTDATQILTVTVQAGYGTDEMQFSCYNTSGYQMNFVFADMLEARTTEVRSTARGKMLCKKLLNTWSIDSVRGEFFNQNGTGRYSYGLNEGGTTANRPSQPYAWQKYFDTTLGYEVIFRGDTSAWVKSSGTS